MWRPSPRVAATPGVRLLAAVGVALALAGCAATGSAGTRAVPSTTGRAAGGRVSADPVAPTILTESFAGAALPAGWETAGATIERGSAAGDPAAWVHLVAAGTPAYVSPKPRRLATGHSGFTFSGRFRVTARTTGQTVGLATVENARRSENADLFVDARTGRCRVDVFRDDTARSPARCDDGRWHTVTLTGGFGSPATLRWTLDGAPMPAVHSAGLAPTTVHRLWIGDATPGKTNTTDWADLRLRLR